MKPALLSDRLIEFAARMGKVVDALPETRLGRHIAGQLVRCATSCAPNYDEGCAGESRADFVHKLGICLKELRECRTWIRIIIRAELLSKRQRDGVLDECEQLGKIIAKSIVTAKQNRSRPKGESP